MRGVHNDEGVAGSLETFLVELISHRIDVLVAVDLDQQLVICSVIALVATHVLNE